MTNFRNGDTTEDNGAYLPDAETIRAQCAAIRATWDRIKERKALGLNDGHWEPCQVSTSLRIGQRRRGVET